MCTTMMMKYLPPTAQKDEIMRSGYSQRVVQLDAGVFFGVTLPNEVSTVPLIRHGSNQSAHDDDPHSGLPLDTVSLRSFRTGWDVNCLTLGRGINLPRLGRGIICIDLFETWIHLISCMMHVYLDLCGV